MRHAVFAPIVSVLSMIILTVFAGIVSIEIDSIRQGFVIGLDGTPYSSVAPRYAWELQLAVLLCTFSAFLLSFRTAANRRRATAISSAIFGVVIWLFCGSFDIRSANILFPLPIQGFFFGGESLYMTVLISFATVIACLPSLAKPSESSNPSEPLEIKGMTS